MFSSFHSFYWSEIWVDGAFASGFLTDYSPGLWSDQGSMWERLVSMIVGDSVLHGLLNQGSEFLTDGWQPHGPPQHARLLHRSMQASHRAGMSGQREKNKHICID